MQYQLYLKGFQFHNEGDKHAALEFYTQSLVEVLNSKNDLRKQALENIEQLDRKN